MALMLNLAAIATKHSSTNTPATYVVKIDDTNEANKTREECSRQKQDTCQTPCQWRSSSQNQGSCQWAKDITTVAKFSNFKVGEHILTIEDILDFPKINFKIIVFKSKDTLYVIIPAACDLLYINNPEILFELEADIRMCEPESRWWTNEKEYTIRWPCVLYGMYCIYQRISEKMLDYLQKRQERKIVIGGFSLGGSLSRFLVFDLCMRQKKNQIIQCLVAGEKRTGGVDWCRWWQCQDVCQHYSIITSTGKLGPDPVCISPAYSVADNKVVPPVPSLPLATITPCLILLDEGKTESYHTQNLSIRNYPVGQYCFDFLRSNPIYTDYLVGVWPVLSQSMCGIFSQEILKQKKILHNLKSYQCRLNFALNKNKRKRDKLSDIKE